MKPIEVRQRIESETLTLPELRPFIGRKVRITVVDDTHKPQNVSDEQRRAMEFDEQIRQQGIDPKSLEKFLGDFTDEDFAGFDEWIEQTRAEGRQREEADDCD